MRPLERVPAVRRIETDRGGIFAIEITSEFTSADAENLRGLLEGEYALHQRIDLLVRIVNLESFDLEGLSPETATFLENHLAAHVDRCAIIGGQSGEASRLAGLFPQQGEMELRHFVPEEETEAWSWLGAREVEA